MSDDRNSKRTESLGKKIGTIMAMAFLGWMVCGMIMGAGLATTTEYNALIIHALFVPFVFFGVSTLYFSKFDFTTPVQTATIFLVFVILMDFFVVSILINKNFDMFKSILGTWFVFAEIFITTLLTGRYLTVKSSSTNQPMSSPFPN
jgi:hypothetical protein